MNVGDFLTKATSQLKIVGIETARLDALVLMEDILKQDRSLLLAHPERLISESDLGKLNNFIAQRSLHRPLAYIRGQAMFYGREFIVNEHVLVPRAETETMIDLLKNSPLPAHPHIADIGTGSGCIGVTAGLELPGSKILLCDIDPAALEVAANNAKLLKLSIRTKTSDLLTKLSEYAFDAVLANLPYVPKEHNINKAATFEPPLALFSGDDGLEHYRQFWQQLAVMPQPPRYVFTESMPHQHREITKLAKQAGYIQDLAQDFIQRFVLLSGED